MTTPELRHETMKYRHLGEGLLTDRNYKYLYCQQIEKYTGTHSNITVEERDKSHKIVQSALNELYPLLHRIHSDEYYPEEKDAPSTSVLALDNNTLKEIQAVNMKDWLNTITYCHISQELLSLLLVIKYASRIYPQIYSETTSAHEALRMTFSYALDFAHSTYLYSRPNEVKEFLSKLTTELLVSLFSDYLYREQETRGQEARGQKVSIKATDEAYKAIVYLAESNNIMTSCLYLDDSFNTDNLRVLSKHTSCIAIRNMLMDRYQPIFIRP